MVALTRSMKDSVYIHHHAHNSRDWQRVFLITGSISTGTFWRILRRKKSVEQKNPPKCTILKTQYAHLCRKFDWCEKKHQRTPLPFTEVCFHTVSKNWFRKKRISSFLEKDSLGFLFGWLEGRLFALKLTCTYICITNCSSFAAIYLAEISLCYVLCYVT